MINGSPGDTFENSICKDEKKEYAFSVILNIYIIYISCN
jgi:hypothetical protein